MQISSLFLSPYFCKVQKNDNANKANYSFATNVYSNLAPLQQDVVTFTGRSKKPKDGSQDAPFDVVKDARQKQKQKSTSSTSKSEDKEVDHSDRGQYNVSKRLYEESDYALGQLKYILRNTFNVAVLDIEDSDFERRLSRMEMENINQPVVAITARRKGQKSIAEKMGTRHVRGIKQTKEELKDIVGARIIISGTSTREGDYVLEKLTDAVNKGRLKVTAVKNHGQTNPKLKYATKGRLNQLVDASRKKGNLCTYVDEPRDSGYLAIHVLMDDIADGYGAEIQIMGMDVEKFKNLEDLCYKSLAGKRVEPEYESIKQMFAPMREKTPKGKKLKAEYMEYLRRAYAHERLKSEHKKGQQQEFLRIPDDLMIPKELDFNNLDMLKRKIDRNEEQKNKTEYSGDSTQTDMNAD